MKKKQLTQVDLINLWMTKYYNTTIQEELLKNPSEVMQSSDWYRLYPVTQQQHDEWEVEAKEVYRKYLKLKKSVVDRYWGFTYLNVSPYIKQEESE
jgi:hypothetical protein